MNPRNLVDQATGKIIPAQVRLAAEGRAKFLADHGHDYRKSLADALRWVRDLARSEAYYWKLEHGGGSGPMAYTGGNQGLVSGVSSERSV